MLPTHKHKSRWSAKSFFGSRSANKAVTINQSSNSNGTIDDGHAAIAADASPSGSSADRFRKLSYKSRLRRSGSKVLSFLGLKKTSSKSILP